VEEGHNDTILYTEEWDSDAEFCEHMRSELYRRVLAAMDISKSAPELRFYKVSTAQGLELVDQIRNSPRSTGAGEEIDQLKNNKQRRN